MTSVSVAHPELAHGRAHKRPLSDWELAVVSFGVTTTATVGPTPIRLTDNPGASPASDAVPVVQFGGFVVEMAYWDERHV